MRTMQIREQLELVVNDALKDALAKGALELDEAPSAALERLATNPTRLGFYGGDALR